MNDVPNIHQWLDDFQVGEQVTITVREQQYTGIILEVRFSQGLHATYQYTMGIDLGVTSQLAPVVDALPSPTVPALPAPAEDEVDA
jgi:hypothetical protein